MNLQEPKVEFVPIDQNVLTEAGSSVCSDSASQNYTGGGQRCVGTQLDATVCPDWNSNNPW